MKNIVIVISTIMISGEVLGSPLQQIEEDIKLRQSKLSSVTAQIAKAQNMSQTMTLKFWQTVGFWRRGEVPVYTGLNRPNCRTHDLDNGLTYDLVNGQFVSANDPWKFMQVAKIAPTNTVKGYSWNGDVVISHPQWRKNVTVKAQQISLDVQRKLIKFHLSKVTNILMRAFGDGMDLEWENSSTLQNWLGDQWDPSWISTISNRQRRHLNTDIEVAVNQISLTATFTINYQDEQQIVELARQLQTLQKEVSISQQKLEGELAAMRTALASSAEERDQLSAVAINQERELTALESQVIQQRSVLAVQTRENEQQRQAQIGSLEALRQQLSQEHQSAEQRLLAEVQTLRAQLEEAEGDENLTSTASVSLAKKTAEPSDEL